MKAKVLNILISLVGALVLSALLYYTHNNTKIDDLSFFGLLLCDGIVMGVLGVCVGDLFRKEVTHEL